MFLGMVPPKNRMKFKKKKKVNTNKYFKMVKNERRIPLKYDI